MGISSRSFVAFLFGIIISVSLFGGAFIVSAQSEVDKLKSEISERNNRLAEIAKEIAQYKLELQQVGAEKNTLQKAINQLELERKKVQADISYTQNKIGATDLMLSQLGFEITDTEETIDRNEVAIGETIRLINVIDNDSLVEGLLQHPNLSDFWKEVEELEELRTVMSDKVKSLVSQRQLLIEKHEETSERRGELVDLKKQYSDQNSILTSNKSEKDKLLKSTKSEEAEYQRLLQERESARLQIEKELRDFESKLQFILDPNTIPPRGTAVFNWPVETVRITQLFGGTEFAKSNPGIYGRGYHPGVDFGVPAGTKIMAPLSGVVRATGNTDLVAGCYSWGKWTLIDHANGLSTLYAHQSVISVTPGQQVSTGETIGYSGNTGLTTGPHLHFTVYAKAGVSVQRFSDFKAVTSCGAATTPVAAADAYIDPMTYLPTL
jgi:murein DD-endopeptidase MepM/ murein hydrolase activator NlpD